MKKLNLLDIIKLDEKRSQLIYIDNTDEGSGGHVYKFGVFLKRWICDKKNKNKQRQLLNIVPTKKKKEQKAHWIIEETSIREVQSTKKPNIKKKIIFNKINNVHPAFQTNALMLQNFTLNTLSEKSKKQCGIEIETVDIDKISQVILKSKLVINPLKETIEIITNVKVKKLTLY